MMFSDLRVTLSFLQACLDQECRLQPCSSVFSQQSYSSSLMSSGDPTSVELSPAPCLSMVSTMVTSPLDTLSSSVKLTCGFRLRFQLLSSPCTSLLRSLLRGSPCGQAMVLQDMDLCKRYSSRLLGTLCMPLCAISAPSRATQS